MKSDPRDNFLAESRFTLREALKDFANEDWEKVFLRVHTFKGSAGFMNLESLQEAADELESFASEAARTPPSPSKAAMAQQKLESCLFKIEAMAFARRGENPSNKEDLTFANLVDGYREPFQMLLERLGKKARLEVQGDAILDAKTYMVLQTTLNHLLRNCAVHGIETPAYRTKISKNPVGKVWLKTWSDGKERVVEVSDDGAGMEQRALSRIFDLKYSTAKEKSVYAGAGAGLNAALLELEGAGGALSASSSPSFGATFKITLPLHNEIKNS